MNEPLQAEKSILNWDRITSDAKSILEKCRPHGLEAHIVQMFRQGAEQGQFEDRIPHTAHDTTVYEMAFKFGRADIVIFHFDGSASVIEVKDGTKGYNHVVSGIGQAGLYSTQLAIAKGTLTKVRKCLLWTSTGDVALDGVIEETCEAACVVPLPWGELSTHLAYQQAARQAKEST